MGLKRLIKKKIYGRGHLIRGHIIDAIIKKEKSGRPFGECLKESFNETLQEDMPIISQIYQSEKMSNQQIWEAAHAPADQAKSQDTTSTTPEE